MSKTFTGKFFVRSEALRGMYRQSADRFINTDYVRQIGFKVELTSKAQLGIVFEYLLTFFMKIIWQVKWMAEALRLSNTIIGKLFVRYGAFREMERNRAAMCWTGCKICYTIEVGFNMTLTSKMQLGNAFAEPGRSKIWSLSCFFRESAR